MFSLYYVVKNIIDEIKSSDDYERNLYKLSKENNKLKACMQKYTAKFYMHNYDRGYVMNKFVLLNHIHEVEHINNENVDTVKLLTYSTKISIKELTWKTKDKIKELKAEMRSM